LTDDVYNRLNEYRKQLELFSLNAGAMNDSTIRDIDKIYREYNPVSPIDMGCGACQVSRMKEVYVHLLTNSR